MLAALDPNWFYSTLAQSTAAIVGLGGAFLVQRILQQRNEVATPRFDLQQNMRQAFKKVASARESADLIARSLEMAAETGRIRQESFGDFRVENTVYAYRAGEGVRGVGNGIPVDLEFRYIAIFADAAEAAEDFLGALPGDFNSYVRMLETHGGLVAASAKWLEEDVAPIPEPTHAYPVLDHVEHQRDHLRQWWRELQEGSERWGLPLQRFRARLVPESFRWLLRIMVSLLIVGTIVPMFYLSVRDEGSRFLLLLPFAALALAFFWFIGAELRQLRKAGDLTQDTF
jgi:hypothetical protein